MHDNADMPIYTDEEYEAALAKDEPIIQERNIPLSTKYVEEDVKKEYFIVLDNMYPRYGIKIQITDDIEDIDIKEWYKHSAHLYIYREDKDDFGTIYWRDITKILKPVDYTLKIIIGSLILKLGESSARA